MDSESDVTGKVVTVQAEKGVMSAADIKANVQRIQEVMQAVMRPDTHYGRIPGTPKKSLYKAGSEVLLSTFRIAVDPLVEDLSDEDCIRYRVKCRGVHIGTGALVGAGIGEASSNEEKYKWRAAVCDEEYLETPENRRRVKYRRYEGNLKKIQQVRTDPDDSANTVLKMAKKRAQVDLTLTALAASDIFTQDLEDELPPAGFPPDDGPHPKADAAPPRARTATPADTASRDQGPRPQHAVATGAQIKLIRARLDATGVREADLFKEIGVADFDSLPFEKVNAALDYISRMAP